MTTVTKFLLVARKKAGLESSIQLFAGKISELLMQSGKNRIFHFENSKPTAGIRLQVT